MPAAVKRVEFTIDCSIPCSENIMEIGSYEQFLLEHIKVNNKVNNLGDVVSVSRSDNKINIVASCQMAKRYLKYLTKKYLKKQGLRDYLRVLAAGKNGYKLVYFSVAQEDEE